MTTKPPTRQPGRWLIVGCGYVGTQLGRMLAESRAATEVIGVRRHAPSEALPFTCIAADCAAPDFAERLPGGDFDTVVYCAAAKSSDPAVYEETYVRNAKRLVGALQKRQSRPARLLFTSSTAVFEADDGRAVDEATPCNPQAFRGHTMLQAEHVFTGSGWPAVVLRLGGIYGPTRTHFLRSVAEGRARRTQVPVYANRIHRDDCAGALLHLGALAAPESLYVGVDSAPAARNEVIAWVCDRIGAPLPPMADEAPTQFGKRCQNERLRQSGYAFKYPTYREGYGELWP